MKFIYNAEIGLKNTRKAIKALKNGAKTKYNIVAGLDSILEGAKADNDNDHIASDENCWLGQFRKYLKDMYGDTGHGHIGIEYHNVGFISEDTDPNHWVKQGDYYNPGPWFVDIFSGVWGGAGTSAYTSVVGATAALKFDGSGFKLIHAPIEENGTFYYLVDSEDEVYVDTFEDGLLTGRTSPLRDYTTPFGTAGIESSSPLNGSYSFKHTGNGSNNYSNVSTFLDSLTNYILEFDFKLTNQGSGGTTPHLFLAMLRYVDANNQLRVETYYDGVNQYIRLRQHLGGAGTTIASATWKSGKLDTTNEYHFKIIDTSTHIEVWVDGVRLINADYTSTVPVTKKGFGANYNCAGLWDDILIIPECVEVNTSAPTSAFAVTEITGLSEGEHTLNLVKSGDGKEIRIIGGYPTKGDAGFQVNCLGTSGSVAKSSAMPGPLMFQFEHFQPVLTVLGVGANDYTGWNNHQFTSSRIDNFEIYLESIVRKAREYGDVILMTTDLQPVSDTETVTLEEFNDVIRDVAFKYNCCFIDIYNAWGADADVAYNNGYLATNITVTPNIPSVHPLKKGHDFIFEQGIQKAIEVPFGDDNCYIGPVALESPQLVDENKHGILSGDDPNKQFEVICKQSEGIDILGVYNWKDMIWIDASTSLINNEHFAHRGFHKLATPEVIFDMGVNMVTVLIQSLKYGSDPNEVLELFYTTGVGDGTLLESTYEDETLQEIFLEDFDDFDTTTIWRPVNSSNASVTIAKDPSAEKLKFTVAASNNGTFGGGITELRQKIETPVIIDFDLEWLNTISSGHPHGGLYITGDAQQTWNDLHLLDEGTDWFRLMLEINTTAATIRGDKCVAGNAATIINNPLTSSQKNPAFRLKYDEYGRMEIWVNKSGLEINEILDPEDPEYQGDVKLLSSTDIGLTFKNEIYLILDFTSDTTETNTLKINGLKASRLSTTIKPNVVAAFPSSYPTVTPDDYRDSEYGLIPVYNSPIEPILFQIEPLILYYEGVQVYRVVDEQEYRVYNKDEAVLTPGQCHIKNGLTKVEINEDNISLYAWVDYRYQFIRSFDIGIINLVKIAYLNNLVCSLQVNDTIITLRHGDYGFYWKHSNTTINIDKNNVYERSNATTTNPSADQDIEMLTSFFCNAYQIYDNLAQPNAALGTNLLGTIEGFEGVRETETLESSTEWGSIGERSLKVRTPGTENMEGAVVPVMNFEAGKSYAILLEVNIPFGELMRAVVADETTLFYGEGRKQEVLFIFNNESGAEHAPGIVTHETRDLEFYIGSVRIIEGDEMPESVLNEVTGDLEEKFRIQFVKTDPEVIKSDSLPPSELTIINFYDAEIASDTDMNYFKNIAREMHNQTKLSVKIAQI